MHVRFALVVVVLSACSVDPVDHELVLERGSGCSVIECGENAAMAGDGLLFDEVALDGTANYAGTHLTYATLPSGHSGKVDIQGAELSVYDPSTSTRFTGSDLVNTIIHFKHDSGVTFDILIDAVDKQTVSYVTGNPDLITVYEMKARVSTAYKKGFAFFVCNNDELDFDPTWTSSESHYALVFRGDRYDGDALTAMSIDPRSPWAFIACNGSAATKLQLWRHTYAGAFSRGYPTYLTPIARRTAMLKAITADYCGNGTSFTVAGTPLVFATAEAPNAWPFHWSHTLFSVEARWTPYGASCLDEPRRLYYDGWPTHADVEWACGHPIARCTTGATSFPEGWYKEDDEVITGNPNPALPPP